jgi:putative heme-binding domain-containing protein
MAKIGGGRMPYLGSEFVDEEGVRLVHDWIKQLPRRPEDDTLLSRLREPSTSEFMREDALTKLLATTSGALVLARAVADNQGAAFQLPPAVRQEAIQAAMARPDPQVRDLFERFITEEQRVKRLGTSIDPKKLLAVKGDPARGKDLFFNNTAMQCKTCHRIGGVGSTVGPDLSAIGKKHDRAKLLENLLEPSKVIEPAYVSYLIETKDGQVHTGILAEKSAKEIVLKNANDKETRIPADKVVTLLPQKTSIMPEQLLRDMTAEQVADLLAYLETLK